MYISPVLFNFVIDWIMTKVVTTISGIEVTPIFVITDLGYTDYISLLPKYRSERQPMLSEVAGDSSLVGLMITS